MNVRVAEILDKIGELERELEAEFDKKRKELNCWFEKRKVHFDPKVVSEHRKLKRGLLDQIRNANLAYAITAPFIYSMIIPLLSSTPLYGHTRLSASPHTGSPR